jgi:tetratricopeptide (TPR) repeat protein
VTRGAIAASIALLVSGTAFLALTAGGERAWATIGAAVAGVVGALVWDQPRAWTALDALTLRPSGLAPAFWLRWHSAQWARLRGRWEDAATALAPLPATTAVVALRGLIALRRLQALTPLERLLLEARHTVAADDAAAIGAQLRECDPRPLAAWRVATIDAVVADGVAPRPLFAAETGAALAALTGQPLCAEGRALPWLTARLWGLRLWEAAVHVAARADDERLATAANLAHVMAQGPRTRPPNDWVAENAGLLCLLPTIADGAGLLHLDARFVVGQGPGATARRLQERGALIDLWRAVWSDYAAEVQGGAATVLVHLSGCPAQQTPNRRRFERWWREEGHHELAHDQHFAAGLSWAAMEEWARAEQSFAEAATARPRRTSATYNRVVCLTRIERLDEAERLLEALTEQEPQEAFWWLRLGDNRRAQGHLQDALAALAKAIELAGLQSSVALRLGVTLADGGRHREAREILARTLGERPSADALRQLAAFLDAEGHAVLARHYRARAVQALAQEAIDTKDEDGPETVH